MRELFWIEDSLPNKISYYHIMLLMASLPFDMFYSHLILISYTIHTLIQLNLSRIKPVFKLRTIILQSVFFITVLSTIYTTNTAGAFNNWGKQITIFLFPLVFCFNPLDIKKYKSQLLLSFALVCTATIAYLFINAILTIRHFDLPYSMLFSSYFTNHNFAEPINAHATFFSMQVALSMVYLLSIVIKQRSFYKKLFYSLCCLMLASGLIQLSAKSVFICLIIIVNAAIPYFLLKGSTRWKYVAITSSLTLLLFAGILYSGNFRERYITDLKRDLSTEKKLQTTDSRLERWNVAVQIIAKSPVIGYGMGSEVGLLHDGFFNKKLYNSFLYNLNAHNQYLSFLINSGVIGLLVYLCTLIFGFKIAIRQHDLFFFTFMALVVLVSLSESFLDVDKGIIFYSFFFSFFFFSYDQAKEIPEHVNVTNIFNSTGNQTADSSVIII